MRLLQASWPMGTASHFIGMAAISPAHNALRKAGLGLRGKAIASFSRRSSRRDPRTTQTLLPSSAPYPEPEPLFSALRWWAPIAVPSKLEWAAPAQAVRHPAAV